jgi:beta-glucosidase
LATTRPYDVERDNRVDDEVDLDWGYNSNYLDVGAYPLYPFRFGLSYTSFQDGPVELSTVRFRAGQTLAVRAPVTNAGEVGGDEVVQLSVRNLVVSRARPARELEGFRRVHLQPGKRKVIEIVLSTDDLRYDNNEEQLMLEPGKFEV